MTPDLTGRLMAAAMRDACLAVSCRRSGDDEAEVMLMQSTPSPVRVVWALVDLAAIALDQLDACHGDGAGAELLAHVLADLDAAEQR